MCLFCDHLMIFPIAIMMGTVYCGIPLGNPFKDVNIPGMHPTPRPNLTAVVLIADGTEEMEAVTVIDLLRRAEILVTVAGVQGADPVTCKYGCVLTPDISLEAALEQPLYDLVFVPGGEEACNIMAQSDNVGLLLRGHVEGDRFLSATTAGPIVLDAHNINHFHRITSDPEYSDKLKKHYFYHGFEDTIVDIEGRMITGQYSGTILEFGLSLINHIADRKTADKVCYGLQPFMKT